MSEYADYDDSSDDWDRRIDEQTRFATQQRRLLIGFGLGCAGTVVMLLALVATIVYIAN
jgi:hypothetical protein